MKSCDYCKRTILFGGYKLGNKIFCNKDCAEDFKSPKKGFCESCLAETTTNESEFIHSVIAVGAGAGRTLGDKLGLGGLPTIGLGIWPIDFQKNQCPKCGSVIVRLWMGVLIPIIPLNKKYRVLTLRHNPDHCSIYDYLVRKLKIHETAIEARKDKKWMYIAWILASIVITCIFAQKPIKGYFYANRGLSFGKNGQYQRAIEDFNKAIYFKPDYSDAYINRGNTYYLLGQYQRAIDNFNEAILLKPKYAIAYYKRGVNYSELDQHQLAIEDFNEAIRLNPKDTIAAYQSRGIAYGKLDQHQLAIEDFNECIRLKPDYADAYICRGNAYFKQGKNELGCRDSQKACNLGMCKMLEIVQSQGFCR
ncbi:MAG: tetratricopeptide repeat protein [Smithellaceae bacterium]